MGRHDETVWAWLRKDGWVEATACGGPEYGCGSRLRPAHKVRTNRGIRRSYWTQYRNPSLRGSDKPTGRVWSKGETVWARLRARGWTKARVYAFTWCGDMASVWLGRARGPSSYLVDRATGLRPRDSSLAGRDKPQET